MEFDPENDPNEAFECFREDISDGTIKDENEKIEFIKNTICDELNGKELRWVKNLFVIPGDREYLYGIFGQNLGNLMQEKCDITEKLKKAELQAEFRQLLDKESDGDHEHFLLLGPEIRSRKVLHFSIHGAYADFKNKKEGTLDIRIEGPLGQVVTIRQHSLIDFILECCEIPNASKRNNNKGSVMCVVLNACNSEEIGKELVKRGVPFVIYWSTLLNNKAGIDFSRAFYTHLGASLDDSEDFQGGFDKAVKFLEETKWKLEDPVNPYQEELHYRRGFAGIPHLDGAGMLLSAAADASDDGMTMDEGPKL